MDIIEAIKSGGEWWILRDAFQIEPEVRKFILDLRF